MMTLFPPSIFLASRFAFLAFLVTLLAFLLTRLEELETGSDSGSAPYGVRREV